MECRENIPLFKVAMSEEVNDPLLKQLHSGWIGQGNRVAEFETYLWKKFDNPNVLTLSAGTHGLTLALRLAGVDSSSSVISTPLTCTATNIPIVQEKANIIWSDVKDDLNIDPKDVETLLKHRDWANIKAVVAVHWGGYPCDMEELHNICTKYNVKLITDAAHAYGSFYENNPIGSCMYSDYTMFSFQAIKHLTTIDGGALCLKEKDDYDRAKLLRWYGIDRETERTDFRCENDILEAGWKFHMNDICATVGIYNMELADNNINIARENVEYYNQELKKIDGIYNTQIEKNRSSSHWLYTVLVENRTEFMMMMINKGISVSRVHERNDKHTFTKKFKRPLRNFEESVYPRYCCIPVGWWVDVESREYIIDCIKKGW